MAMLILSTTAKAALVKVNAFDFITFAAT